ncbi:hypothetical protein ACYT86_21960, partial [Pseudomonas idahonensis]
YKKHLGIPPVAAAEPSARLREGPQDLAWHSPAKPLSLMKPLRPRRLFAALSAGQRLFVNEAFMTKVR